MSHYYKPLCAEDGGGGRKRLVGRNWKCIISHYNMRNAYFYNEKGHRDRRNRKIRYGKSNQGCDLGPLAHRDLDSQ